MKKKSMALGGLLGGIAVAATATALYFRNRATIPAGVTAVAPFDVKKFLGKWYEIARLDYRMERKLDNVTAEYSLKKDGSLKVVNTGYNYVKSKQEKATGTAHFVQSPDTAMLKVNFGGPVSSGYNVIAIDKNYKYALVVGHSLDYMWLLSREPKMPAEVKKEYLKKAMDLGFKIEKLIWSEHK